MSKASDFSRTVRIDLIPETPSEPVADKRRVVMASIPRSGGPAPLSNDRDNTEGGRYTALLESIYDAALITDMDGNVVDANTRACEFLLWDKDALRERSIDSLISGAERSLLSEIVRNLEKQRFVLLQAYCHRRDDSLFPSEIAVARIRTDEDRLGFFIRDITLRRHAEEMLRTEHNAIQNAANGIAIANLDGIFEYVNPAFAQMMESKDQSYMIGDNIRDLFEGRGVADELMQSLRGERGSWSSEVSAEMPSGRVVALEVMANCNRNSDGEIVGFVFSFTDLSDRKRAEAAQREVERNRVMLETLGTACHHLGQPATLLMGNLSLLREKVQADDPLVRELLQSSADAIERLGDILHKLNQVNEYRTTTYMEHAGKTLGETTNILDI